MTIGRGAIKAKLYCEGPIVAFAQTPCRRREGGFGGVEAYLNTSGELFKQIFDTSTITSVAQTIWCMPFLFYVGAFLILCRCFGSWSKYQVQGQPIHNIYKDFTMKTEH